VRGRVRGPRLFSLGVVATNLKDSRGLTPAEETDSEEHSNHSEDRHLSRTTMSDEGISRECPDKSKENDQGGQARATRKRQRSPSPVDDLPPAKRARAPATPEADAAAAGQPALVRAPSLEQVLEAACDYLESSDREILAAHAAVRNARALLSAARQTLTSLAEFRLPEA
jgi:hypothetical protein